MTTTTEGRALQVLDRTTGEVLDVAAATEVQLARFVTNLDHLRDELKAAEDLVHHELLARLDRGGKWTRRIDGEDAIFEITAPSPTAGTEEIDPEVLERELRTLARTGDIYPEAAAAALERKVTVVFELDLEDDADAFIDKARRDPKVRSAELTRAARKAGVKALAKISGKGARAVTRATARAAPPKRKPKVKLKPRREETR